MTRLYFIVGVRDSESKLKLLEALRLNDNLTVEELLQLIQYRTQAKRFAENSVHQSTSSVVAYSEKRGPNNKKDLSRHQKQEHCGRCGRKPFHLFMSATLRMKSATIVRSKDTILDCAKLKDKKPREQRETLSKIKCISLPYL